MFGKIFRLLAVFILAILIQAQLPLAAAPEVAYEKMPLARQMKQSIYLTLGNLRKTKWFLRTTLTTRFPVRENRAEVHIMVFDEELDRYRDLELIIDDTDPENPEKITSFVVEGLFSWDIDLPYMGINKIRLVGVKDDKYKIVDREITVLDPSTKEEIINFYRTPLNLFRKQKSFSRVY